MSANVDYALLPPEINSGRMYTGPGVGSLLAAATAWAELAAQLHASAASYRSVISALTGGPWLGPASLALAAAAATNVAWLRSSAESAELTFERAGAAVAAYETAFGLTVPPPVIAANRAVLASLIATNVLGQNSAAIATVEAEYFEMWAQDAAAMYGYVAASATATQLTDFAEPEEVTDPAGSARQAAAVAKAVGNSAHTGAQDVAANDPATPTFGNLKPIDEWISENTPLDDMAAMYSKYVVPYVSSGQVGVQTAQSFGQISNGITAMTTFGKGLLPAASSAAQAAGGGTNALGAAGAGLGNAGSAAAGLGRALPIGALSVPPSWAPVTAVTNPGVTTLTSAAPAAADGLHPFPMAPFGPMTGHTGWRQTPTYGFKPSVMTKPPAAG
ncbi:putative PPE family protein PPE19 [Mycobacterium seoulense]|uniref:Putative PPE family protein PPE19 n=1 Tax=Mycobacterium seoulense TaxID=386911 RepID=A0A7I7P5R7_9MYCO|nr:PPE family protein [Mycobacterium seoulense]MCV7439158.1 PPE family protein [Mycobacterium seoulense]BBY04223.1 putative PPE family protein PPE19 [Mycobacterium seoulense]